jgi:uncharacterized membrane protein SirB2
MALSIVFIVVGGAMFFRFREARSKQERTKAWLLALGSALFAAFGLTGLLGAILA